VAVNLMARCKLFRFNTFRMIVGVSVNVDVLVLVDGFFFS